MTKNALKKWLNKDNKILFKMKFNKNVFYKRILFNNRDVFCLVQAYIGAGLMTMLLILEGYHNINLWTASSFVGGGLFLIFVVMINKRRKDEKNLFKFNNNFTNY